MTFSNNVVNTVSLNPFHFCSIDSDSHPLFFRGKEDWCRDIRRPPVKPRGYSKTDMDQLERTFLQEALLNDLCSLDVFSSSNTNLVRSAKKRLDFPGNYSCPNLQTSMAHSIANGGATTTTATARSLILLLTEDLHLVSPSSPLIFDDTNVPGVPLKVIESNCQFPNKNAVASGSFVVATNPILSRSFNCVRSNFNWQPSPFLPAADDDEMSIGTIDSISNIENCTYLELPTRLEVGYGYVPTI